jgi:transposase
MRLGTGGRFFGEVGRLRSGCSPLRRKNVSAACLKPSLAKADSFVRIGSRQALRAPHALQVSGRHHRAGHRRLRSTIPRSDRRPRGGGVVVPDPDSTKETDVLGWTWCTGPEGRWGWTTTAWIAPAPDGTSRITRDFSTLRSVRDVRRCRLLGRDEDDQRRTVVDPEAGAGSRARRPPHAEERRTAEAIASRMRIGAVWRSVPAELGPWWKAAQLHIRWSRAGVWERLFAELRDAGRPELGEVFLDASSVRAHQKAAGAKGGAGCTPWAARAGDGAPRRPSPAMPEAARSRSC